MGFDGQTLFVTLVVTSAFAGLLLLWVWLQNKPVRALEWWGLAYLLASLGMTLAAFRGRWPDRLTIDVANGLVFGGYGLMWTGARAFSARRPWLILSLVQPGRPAQRGRPRPVRRPQLRAACAAPRIGRAT